MKPATPAADLEMADIGLDRADQQRRLRIAPLPQNPPDRSNFDRIAERSASPVRLDITNVRALKTSRGERVSHHGFLSWTVRRGETGAPPILIDGAAANRREDPIAVALGVGKPLQHHHPASLAAREAVGCRIKRLAPPVCGEHVTF